MRTFPKLWFAASALALGCNAYAAKPASMPKPAPHCPPMAVYQVSNITLHNATLAQAVPAVFAGTAWTGTVGFYGRNVHVSMNHVGGPLDQVVDALVSRATGPRYTVTSTTDTKDCVVHINVLPVVATAHSPAVTAPTHTAQANLAVPPSIGSAPATPVPVASAHQVSPAHRAAAGAPVAQAVAAPKISVTPITPPRYILPKGVLLSKALAKYVAARGWTLKWNVADDYMLAAPFPIPAGSSVIQGVTYVVHTYQTQGGMLHDLALFARPNHVVAIIPATARSQELRQ